MAKLEELCQKLSYHFNDEALLKRALTHRSISGQNNNERLEFLGDALLNFVIAESLYQQYSYLREGELSRMRAALVNGETLAKLAKELEIGKFLRLGSGEVKSGGAERQSILADTMEAIIGALYLDAGMETCQDKVLCWYQKQLAKIDSLTAKKDPKTALQEHLQSQKLALPTYEIVMIKGKSHAQVFYVQCKIEEIAYVGEGRGTSRRKAEQEAAQKMLNYLGAE